MSRTNQEPRGRTMLRKDNESLSPSKNNTIKLLHRLKDKSLHEMINERGQKKLQRIEDYKIGGYHPGFVG